MRYCLEVFVIMGILALWVLPIALGIRAARRKHRSPHWMWFGIHPLAGWVAFLVLRSQPGLLECPNCAEKVKAHARICPYCLTPFEPSSIQAIPQADDALGNAGNDM